MKTAPLAALKARFGEKAKLVDALSTLTTDELWLARVNDAKGLGKVSNAKLLRLHDVLTRVKKDFGSRTKLIDAILALEKRQKDTGLRGKLEQYPTPRLLDLHASAGKRAKTAAKTAKAKKPASKKKKTARKKPRTKKAQAKAKAAGKP